MMNPTQTPAATGVLLTRKQAVQALGERGFPVSDKTLATMATRGGSPVFHHFGQRVLYRWDDVMLWAEGRLGPPCSSTSEVDAKRAEA